MIIESRFKPAWWLPGSHLQTLWPYLLRRRPRLDLETERLALPDGDFVDLAWTPDQDSTRPLVIVLHGLEGSVRSHYATPLLNQLYGSGFTAVVLHFRGCSGVPNRHDRSYNAGDTQDIDFVIETLTARFPGRKRAAVGYSLGGNVLLKWLAERGGDAPLGAAAGVSVPFDLHLAAERLERGLSRLYQRALLRQLRRGLQRKFAGRPSPLDLTRLRHLRSFRAFDDYVTAPLHGYAGVDDYYDRASCRQHLSQITVPTLLVHSRDDPFLMPAGIPRSDELAPHTTLELADRGGHVGFVGGGIPGRAVYWIERRLSAYLTAHLNPSATGDSPGHTASPPATLQEPSTPR